MRRYESNFDLMKRRNLPQRKMRSVNSQRTFHRPINEDLEEVQQRNEDQGNKFL